MEGDGTTGAVTGEDTTGVPDVPGWARRLDLVARASIGGSVMIRQSMRWIASLRGINCPLTVIIGRLSAGVGAEGCCGDL